MSLLVKLECEFVQGTRIYRHIILEEDELDMLRKSDIHIDGDCCGQTRCLACTMGGIIIRYHSHIAITEETASMADFVLEHSYDDILRDVKEHIEAEMEHLVKHRIETSSLHNEEELRTRIEEVIDRLAEVFDPGELIRVTTQKDCVKVKLYNPCMEEEDLERLKKEIANLLK